MGLPRDTKPMPESSMALALSSSARNLRLYCSVLPSSRRNARASNAPAGTAPSGSASTFGAPSARTTPALARRERAAPLRGAAETRVPAKVAESAGEAIFDVE